MDLYSSAAYPQLSYYSPSLKNGLASHIHLSRSLSSFCFFSDKPLGIEFSKGSDIHQTLLAC